MPFRVFLSSREKELAEDRDAAHEGIEVTRSYCFRSELAKPGTELSSEIRRADLMILLLRKELSPAVRQEIAWARESQVPIKVFVGEIEAGHCRDPELDDFLKSEILPFGTLYARYGVPRELKSKVADVVFDAIHQRATGRPDILAGRDQLYNAAANLVERTERFLYVAQNTPTIFFPPPRLSAESRFLAAWNQWMEERFDSERITKECCLIYSRDATYEAIRDSTDVHLDERVQKAICDLCELEKKYEGRFRLVQEASKFDPMIVSDAGLGIWVRGRTDDFLFFTDSHPMKVRTAKQWFRNRIFLFMSKISLGDADQHWSSLHSKGGTG